MSIFKEMSNTLKDKQLINSITKEIFSYEDVKDIIISTIQQRLSSKGIDSANNELKTNSGLERGAYYATSTAKRKKKEKPVDLHDTGKFYDSFRVHVSDTFYSILANFKRGAIYTNFTFSYNNFDSFEEKILSLSNLEWASFLNNVFIPEFRSLIIYKLLK